MSTSLTLEALPDVAGVLLSVLEAPAGDLDVLRTDVNGTHPVRLLPDQAPIGGRLTIRDYEAALAGDVTYSLAGTRTNGQTNSTFATSTAGWVTTPAGTTVTWEAAGLTANPGAALVAGAVNGSLIYNSTATPAGAGEVWTASAYVKGTAGQTVDVALVSYTAAGVSLAGFRYDTVVLSGGVDRVAQTVTTPATTGGLRFIVRAGTAASFRVDDYLLERSPVLGDYLEGTQDAAIVATTRLDVLDRAVVSVPVRPALRFDSGVVTDWAEESDSSTIVHQVPERPDPIVVTGPLRTRAGSGTLRVPAYGDADTLRSLVQAGDVLLVRQPDHAGLDAYLVAERVSVAPVDDDWEVRLTYTEVAAPAGPLLGAADWTLADVAAQAPTLGALAQSFQTLRALAVGP